MPKKQLTYEIPELQRPYEQSQPISLPKGPERKEGRKVDTVFYKEEKLKQEYSDGPVVARGHKELVD